MPAQVVEVGGVQLDAVLHHLQGYWQCPLVQLVDVPKPQPIYLPIQLLEYPQGGIGVTAGIMHRLIHGDIL